MSYQELNNLTVIAVVGTVVYFIWNWFISTLRIRETTNRYVFITGCDTGFGNQLAKKLDSTGIRVIAGCLTETGRNELEREASTRLKTIHVDVTCKHSVEHACTLVKETVKEHGRLLAFLSM